MGTQEISTLLNKFSGILGISGVSSDMREIEDAVERGEERAQLALKMYNYRIKKYVGSYTAVLGGLDILVFRGGVGENMPIMRKAVCENMEYMGIELDDELNNTTFSREAVISKPTSKVRW